MFIAEGQMRGNQGLFIIEEAQDSADATNKLRWSYTCRTVEGCRIKLARKVIDPELEEEIAELLNNPKNAPGMRGYRVLP